MSRVALSTKLQLIGKRKKSTEDGDILHLGWGWKKMERVHHFHHQIHFFLHRPPLSLPSPTLPHTPWGAYFTF